MPWPPGCDHMISQVLIQMLSNVVPEFENQGHLSGAWRPHSVNFQSGVDPARAFPCVHCMHTLAVFYGTGRSCRQVKLIRSSVFLTLCLPFSLPLWANWWIASQKESTYSQEQCVPGHAPFTATFAEGARNQLPQWKPILPYIFPIITVQAQTLPSRTEEEEKTNLIK